jgi:hypothetical protein
VGSKRPSLGGNGGHVVWWIGLIFWLLCGICHCLTAVSHSAFTGPESPHLRWMVWVPAFYLLLSAQTCSCYFLSPVLLLAASQPSTDKRSANDHRPWPLPQGAGAAGRSSGKAPARPRANKGSGVRTDSNGQQSPKQSSARKHLRLHGPCNRAGGELKALVIARWPTKVRPHR